ncbi:MAG TPA: ABC transporter substrate-binding protein, partial [Acidobacteriota bacterium]|nr:ABC transporter substrate-binding protein [Acidobacteriota bacterium]
EIRTYLTDVLEVIAIDSQTVKVRTSSPLAILLNKLYNVFIIPKGSTKEQLEQRVNGTGPYLLAEWKKGESIRMIRNEDYWGKKPSLNRVTYYLGRGPDQAVATLASGQCQFAQYDSKAFEAIVRSYGNFEVHKQDNLFLKYLSYDVSRDQTPYCKARPNPFKNKFVRQAIHVGIDRTNLVAELPTYATPASQPVPAFVFGFNPAIVLPTHSIERAKQLLTEAGYPGGFDVVLHERQILEQTGSLLKEQLQKIGIRLELKALPDQQFFSALDAADFSFFLSRVGATVGDASDILEPQLHTKDSARHLGVRNYITYGNAEVDRAIEESAGILKLEERRSVLQEIMSKLMEDLPWIPPYIDQDVYAVENSFVWRPRPDSYVLAYEISLR